MHGGVHLVAGAVQEAGVDEGHAGGGGGDGRLQVDGGAALLVHDAQLHGVGLQAQQLFDAAEQLVGKAHFHGAVHLGLDDVDTAGAAVADAVGTVALQVVHGDGGGHHRVQNAFGDFLAFGAPQDGWVGHQVAHIAQEHQRAAMQRDGLAVGAGIAAVAVQTAGQRLAALFERFGQRALQNAQPVAVAQHLVFGVHGRHGVFQIQDGGHGGFHDHVGHARGVGAADGSGLVDDDVDVQAVVLQQHRGGGCGITLEADELVRVLQAGLAAVLEGDDQLTAFDGIGRGVGMRASGQRHGLVQEVAGKGDDLGAAHGVVALALFCAAFFADGIGAVQRVIQAAPAGVGGVQCVAGVQNGHHQLGAGDLGQFGVHVFGGGLGVLGGLDQVADLRQELLVGRHVGDGAWVSLVPGVQLGLQAVTLGQQGGVLGGQVTHQGAETLPEGILFHTGAGQHLCVHKVVQLVGHLQAVGVGALGHGNLVGRKQNKAGRKQPTRIGAGYTVLEIIRLINRPNMSKPMTFLQK